jgi:hypothetical protein
MKSLFTGIVWGFSAVGVVASFIYVYAVYVDVNMKTPQHTSTVVGSSGDLKCTTSCVVRENER